MGNQRLRASTRKFIVLMFPPYANNAGANAGLKPGATPDKHICPRDGAMSQTKASMANIGLLKYSDGAMQQNRPRNRDMDDIGSPSIQHIATLDLAQLPPNVASLAHELLVLVFLHLETALSLDADGVHGLPGLPRLRDSSSTSESVTPRRYDLWLNRVRIRGLNFHIWRGMTCEESVMLHILRVGWLVDDHLLNIWVRVVLLLDFQFEHLGLHFFLPLSFCNPGLCRVDLRIADGLWHWRHIERSKPSWVHLDDKLNISALKIDCLGRPIKMECLRSRIGGSIVPARQSLYQRGFLLCIVSMVHLFW
jgi:hypothetical protein